ncbi:sugar ABC transporter substrate-binding protein [Dactylosporangium sp. CS-047395]|uniref:sugar ABC transporter substrate-binding protein n=1 Tax=Dactylosporangium sp. CS-047395 TaxID=3239936 RepID=UPI003D8CBDC7
MQWGDLATWISALAALIALAFAAIAAVASYRTFRIELARDERNEQRLAAALEAERRAQAAKVSAWWETNTGACVRNASDSPVYQAHVTVRRLSDRSAWGKLDLPVVPPGDTALSRPIDPPPAVGDWRTRLTFTDAGGVRWLRDEYGRLEELSPRLAIWGFAELSTILERFAADFRAAYGVSVRHTTYSFDDRRTRFLAGVDTEEIADALYGPHDWIGMLAGNGVIDPLVVSTAQRDALQASALAAMTFDGRLYGIPMTIECPVLLRNTDLVPEAPPTFEAMVAAGQRLVADGRAADVLAVCGTPFRLSPLYTSAGGKLFGRDDDGRWSVSRIGVASARSVAALARLGDLGAAGVLRPDAEFADARARFNDGRAALLIGDSRDLVYARRAGVACRVSRVPGFDGGHAPRPYVSVSGFFLTAAGRNRDIAHDLIADYAARPDVMRAVSRVLLSPTAGAVAEAGEADVEALREAAATGDVIPAFPGMDEVWRAVGAAQGEAIAGGDPAAIAGRLHDAIAAAVGDRSSAQGGRPGPRG